MPREPKENPDEETPADESESKYYYDDAHGYEDFDPEDEEEVEDEK